VCLKERVIVTFRNKIRHSLVSLDGKLGVRDWLRNDDNAIVPAVTDPFSTAPGLIHPVPKTVLDIGANVGQFAEEILRVFPSARVLSFEPIPECFKRLEDLALVNPNFKPFNFALSDRKDTRKFYVSRFRDSSSLNPMKEQHLEAWPHTETEREITVPTFTLDEWASGQELERPIFAKFDVQGHEMMALRGGRKTVSMCQRVMIEINFAPLYEGQPTFEELYSEMKGMGFMLDGLVGWLRHPRTQELLSADVIFYKPTETLS
jgi:FkbM family methyltransferase